MTKDSFTETSFRIGMKVKTTDGHIYDVIGVDFNDSRIEVVSDEAQFYSTWLELDYIDYFIF